jgi:hypothetical protein
MILHAPVIALLVGSLLVSYMLLHSSYYGVQILRKWDIASGSELQLLLERKTYLVSTITAYVFAFQLLSLFLFIYTADDLCRLFVGAMCAAGTLLVNSYGYPTLVLKVINFLLAGLWLVINYMDNRARDYPLIKKKYLLLLIITPSILAETVAQSLYFFGLEPNVITSCCGSLFSTDARDLSSGLASFTGIPMKITFYLSMAFTAATGVFFYLKGKGGYLFSSASAVAFVVSVASLISFISLYFYELPTHHCPFCILQREYGYIGYPLYISLLGGGVTGMGVGVVTPFRNIGSLREALPSIQRRLTLASLVFYLLFAIIVTYRIVFSDFRFDGY